MLSINNSKLSNDGGVTNSDGTDVFGMQLLYDQADAGLGNTASYSGRMSAIKWMSSDGAGGTSYERAFNYYYDQLGRDTAAIYAERTAASSSPFTVTHGWDENRITYDPNGNIKTLYRNSATQGAGNHLAIDNLTYTYSSTNPNQLASVADVSGSSQGFMAGAGTYNYDGNGNLTNEPYKGIATIGYDVLNKTDKITFTVSANRYIDYTYDASGSLLRKRQYDNVGGVATLQYTTDYIDGFVYQTAGAGAPVLQYLPMPEGRVVYNGSAFVPTFSINDMQGNARVEFDNSGTGGTLHLRQENSYYAFGLIMPGSVIATPTNPNKKLYNGGSEWQNDFGNLPDYYQTFFRNYDAALGRWVGVDPAPESAESMTTYQYAGNNPVMFNDPLGDVLRTPPPSVNDTYDAASAQPFNSFGAGGGGNHLTTGLNDKFTQNESNFVYEAEGGLMTFDPGAAAYAAITSEQNIYHKGDGTPSDPSRGMKQTDIYEYFNYVARTGQVGTIKDGAIDTYSVVADLTLPLRGGGYGAKLIGRTISLNGANSGGSDGGHASGPRDTPGMPVYYLNSGSSFSIPGIGIFVNKHEPLLTGYIQHEYGHYLQYKSRHMGFDSYLAKIAIPSAWNLWPGGASGYDHDRMEIELEATTLAHDFYGQFSVLNNSDFPTFYTNPKPTPQTYNDKVNEVTRGFRDWSSWGH